MSHRIVLMNEGRVEQTGTPSELWVTPASRFTAGFLGATNSLTGTVIGGDHNLMLAIDDGPRLRLPSGAPVGVGDRATAYIRTSAIELLRDDAGGAVNVVPAEVVGETFHGDYSLVVVRSGGTHLKVRARGLSERTSPSRFAYLNPAQLVVFRDEEEPR